MDAEERMMKAVEEHGVADPGCLLDDLVHDLASKVGSRVNNGGVSEQVRFIFLELGEAEAVREIEELLKGETDVEGG